MTVRRPVGTTGLALAALIVCAGLIGTAQTPAPAATAPLTAKIPVDPAITIGQLDNGLRYYIRKNGRPERRAELRLVVNAGSVLEDNDQRGLAHFVEHMAFNGTTHFPKQAIVAFMESIGMRFGPSVNAFTSMDETVFMLQIPTDDAAVMGKALLVLEDWAQGITFDPVEIDKERGVIIEEWRLRRGAGARMQDVQFPVLLQSSQYASRLPIGDVDLLRTFEHERLIQFYKDWYRPDLMSVIVVGDIDPAGVERQVREQFSAIARPANARPRPVYSVPERAGTTYTIATDPEATTTRVSVYHRMPARDETTIGAYRQQIVEGLFSGMLSDRLAEIAEKPEAPFLGAGVQRTSLVRTTDATYLGAVVKEGGLLPSVDTLFTEAERVARFGFTTTELDRTKVNLLRRLERAVAERDTQQSADLAAEYSRNYLKAEPIPGIVYERDLYQRFLPEITLAEVNALAKTWMPDASRVVMVNAPEKDRASLPTERAIADAMITAPTRTLTAYAEATETRPLLPAIPAPGRVVSLSELAKVGITEWRLSNGIRVVLKPTDFRQDEIVFRAFSDGGSSLASDADYVAASTASQVIDAGGLGTFSAIDLRKRLAGTVTSVRPSIGSLEEGLSGGGSPKDLETLFQRIYLTFTAPRADPQVFDVLKTQTKTSLANQEASPEYAFSKMLSETLTQGHPRARPMTPATVEQMSLEKSLAFYKDRFADAGDFTFVFVGNLDLNVMQPLVERYLASLPSSGRRETWRDEGIKPPKGVVTRTVRQGIEPKSQTAIVFTGPFEYNQERRVAIRAMASVLQTRLRETLREDLGGTYSVSVSPSYSKIPTEEYSVSIRFGSSPDQTDALIRSVFTEIQALRDRAPEDKYVSDTREAMLREFETGLRQNNYLLAQLVGRYQTGESIEGFFTLADDYYRPISGAMIQDAARRYLNTDNYVQVVLLPAAAAQ